MWSLQAEHCNGPHKKLLNGFPKTCICRMINNSNMWPPKAPDQNQFLQNDRNCQYLKTWFCVKKYFQHECYLKAEQDHFKTALWNRAHWTAEEIQTINSLGRQASHATKLPQQLVCWDQTLKIHSVLRCWTRITHYRHTCKFPPMLKYHNIGKTHILDLTQWSSTCIPPCRIFKLVEDFLIYTTFK